MMTSSSGSNASSVGTSSSGGLAFGNLTIYLDADNYKDSTGTNLLSFDGIVIDGIQVIVNPQGTTDADKHRVDCRAMSTDAGADTLRCFESINGNGVRVLTASLYFPVGSYSEIELIPSSLASPARLSAFDISVEILDGQTTSFLARTAADPASFALNYGGGGIAGLEGCWQGQSTGASQYLNVVRVSDPCYIKAGYAWQIDFGDNRWIQGYGLRTFFCGGAQLGAGGGDPSGLKIFFAFGSQQNMGYQEPPMFIKQHPGPC